MKMICNDCDSEFYDTEISWQKELVGEYFGRLVFTDIVVCPYCCSAEIDERKEEE